MDESVRKMIMASIGLLLVSLYGGSTLGSWFYVEGELDDEDSYESIDFTANFNLKGWEYEVVIQEDGDKEDYDDTVDYDDDECSFPDSSNSDDCDEMYDLMQGQIQKLLYVAVLAGGLALYFINIGDQEKATQACLAMSVVGLMAVILFAMNFPEALDDDTEAFEIVDDDPSLLGDNSNYGNDSGLDSDINWRPGFAFLLVLLSGIIGMSAYKELKI